MKSFVIRFPWAPKPKEDPKDIRKRERRRSRHDEKRRLREQEGKK